MALIDKYDLINQICQECGVCKSHFGKLPDPESNAVCKQIEQIQKAPEIDAEPVMYSRWLPRKINGYNVHRCEKCGKRAETASKYCPDCGSRMWTEAQ